MKRLLSYTVAFLVLMFAAVAVAQVGSISSSPLPPLSELGPVVGKTVSVYSYTGSPFYVGISPTTVVSAPVPSKYKSKSQWLIAHVTLQGECLGDYITSTAYVGDVAMYPTQGGFFYTCVDQVGIEPRHVTYFLPPESLGGPAITTGSTVFVQVTSGTGTPRIGFHSIVVQAVK